MSYVPQEELLGPFLPRRHVPLMHSLFVRAPLLLSTGATAASAPRSRDAFRPGITVLMTSFNRRERTLACLRSLFASQTDAALQVILVDDASADGTAGAVLDAFPHVTLVEGTGDLYWAGGMRLAFERASTDPFDYLLWLNDDVVLAADALDLLIKTERALRPARGPSIVVGALQDPTTGSTTYSGVDRPGWRRTDFRQIPPGPEPLRAETMNGNVVLVPRDVAQRLGPFDRAYRHGIADYDYGLRGAAAGIETWIAPAFVGTCARDRSPTPPSAEGLRAMLSPKRLPLRSWLVFTRRHTGPAWPLYWVSPYVRAAVRQRLLPVWSSVRAVIRDPAVRRRP